MQFGLMIAMPGTPMTIKGHIETAQRAEALGFASGWLPGVFGLDPMITLAIAGQETERIELGTAIVPTYPRHPTVLAQQALSTDVAIAGRLVLGIGLSHQIVIQDMYG